MLLNIKIFSISFLMFAVIILPIPSLASSTDGTIDSTNKYAWSNNIGWINFGTSTGNIHITDNGITGYAWSPEYGWINMNPTTSGVKINESGSLSGYAWGENTGWIDFSGVTIDSNGYFTGNATGTIVGTISMNCSNTSSCSNSDFKVSTDYRLSNNRGSGGNILSIINLNPPKPITNNTGKQLNFKLIINNQASSATSKNVTLTINNTGNDVARMAVSNNPNFAGSSQKTFTKTSSWQLSSGNGLKTVYVKLYTNSGTASSVISDTIELIESNNQTHKNTKNSNTGQYKPTVKNNQTNGKATNTISNNNLVKEFGKSAVYLIYKNIYKRPIINGNVFETCNYSWNNIIEVENLDNYTYGFPITMMECKSGKTNNNPSPTKSNQNSNNTIPKINTNFTFTKNLYPGNQNPEVKELQKFLNKNGYIVIATGEGSPGHETNYFGNLTKLSLIKFQEHYSAQILKPFGFSKGTGILGPSTRKFINNFISNSSATKPSNSSTKTKKQNKAVLGKKIIKSNLPSAEFKFGLGINMSNDDVKRLQIILSSMPDIYPSAKITGYFGNLTELAVQKFQLKYNITTPNHPAYGYVGPATRAKLLEIFGK